MSSLRRLVLFDVDGTLIRGGPAKVAFSRALARVFGNLTVPENMNFAGKTDPQIVREVVEGAGRSPLGVAQVLPRVWESYVAELKELLRDAPPERLPGTADLLHALEGRSDVGLGLVTGNVARGARLKLEAVGLAGRFPVGGYGSDHEERDRLPGIAMERARRHWGRPFDPGSVVVVGDTPRDVRCARAHGAWCVAVATGRYSATALREEGPDHVLEDFRDTVRTMELLTDPGGAGGAGAGGVDPSGAEEG